MIFPTSQTSRRNKYVFVIYFVAVSDDVYLRLWRSVGSNRRSIRSRVRSKRTNETCLFLHEKCLTDLPSICPRGLSCRRPGFVAGIHRPQEAIRSFPIRERESGLIFQTVRDLHYIPKPEAVDQEGPRHDSEVAEEPARFLPFVAHGSATRDIVSIVPLIGKINVFRTTASCT